MRKIMRDEALIPPATVFVGRVRERALIERALSDLSTHHGNLVLIAGDAGVGKTALVTAMAQHASTKGARVLVGRCYDTYDTVPPPPYSVWLDLFARYDSAALTVPPPVPFAAGHGLGEIANPAALTAQLRDWLTALAAHVPLVLVLEDLHWADPASLDLLRMIARVVPIAPALALVTYREDALDRAHPLYQLLPHITRESDAARLTLLPLSAAETQALVDARYALPAADTTRLATYLHARAEGNAFLTTELLRTLEAHGTLRPASAGWRLGDLSGTPMPALLRQMIDERVARLGNEAHAVLEVAAAIGHAVPLSLWVRASAWDEHAVLAIAERAIAVHLLRLEAGDSVRFVHALTRDALLAGMPLSRQRQVHRQIAEALRGLAHVDPGIVASHLHAAGDPRALAWLLRAAERAERAYAFKSAMNYLEAALPLLETEPDGSRRRAELLLRISGLTRNAPWAMPYVQEALRIAREVGDPPLIAVAEMRLSFATMLAVLDSRTLLAVQRNALAILEGLSPDALAWLTRVDAVAASLPVTRQFHAEMVAMTGDHRDVFRLLGMTAAEEYRDRPFEDGCAYIALGIAYTGMGRIAEARAAFAGGIAWFNRFEQLGSVGALYEWELNELTLVCETDDRTRRDILAARAERFYADDPAVEGVFPPRYARVGLLAREGAWDEALALLLEMREHLGFLGWVGSHAHTLAYLLAARGETAHAGEMIRTVFPEGHAAAPGGLYLQNALRVQRLAAALALDGGDHLTAHAWLDAHDRWLAWSGAVLGQAEGALAWAGYYRAVGSPDRATAAGDRALALATAPRQPLALLAAHRLRGALATEAGEYGRAATHLDAALALAEACNAPYERAQTLIVRAVLARATGNEQEAMRLLEDARIIANQLGALPMRERIVTLIAASPAPAPPALPSRPRLTAREREVLALIAQGETNAGIGKALALSPRTVDRHIANIYSKINAHNRADAIAFALRAGQE